MVEGQVGRRTIQFEVVVPRVPVFCYSSSGYTEAMAKGIAGRPRAGGATVGGDGSRHPSDNELAGARHQDELVARVTAKLVACPLPPAPCPLTPEP